MSFPQARQTQLVIQEISDELVIYDLKRNKVHTLNPTAAWVWQHCDGKTSHAELASRLQAHLDTPHADDILWLSLDRLEKAHLLETENVPAAGAKITRRQALQKIGVSVAMLPVVASIAAPSAQAASSDCVLIEKYKHGLCDYPSHMQNEVCKNKCQYNDYDDGWAVECHPRGWHKDKLICCCTGDG